MFFQLREIVLWPRDPSQALRRLHFRAGKVNVITGGSKTGKSAIVPIVDYCLGSDRCSIPVETIRKATEWFGIVIDTANGQRLLARREPGSQRSTGEMFVLEGNEVALPPRIIEGNSHVDGMKMQLNALVGLTNLAFDPDPLNRGFKGRPSFRDLMAFVFQPQSIVANPNVLFYGADSHEHREKLKAVFPYVLGAITPELMAKRYTLERLTRELRRKEADLKAVRQVSERWLADLRARVIEARGLGLISQTVPPQATRHELLDLLRGVVMSSRDEVQVTAKAIEESIDELVGLQKEEAEASATLSGLRKRLAEMRKLQESVEGYRQALQVQRDRIALSEWLKALQQEAHSCPVCGGTFDAAKNQVDALCGALHQIEDAVGKADSLPPAFDREIQQVEALVTTATERLAAISIRRKALEAGSTQAKARQFEALKVSRFVGNVEEALKTYEAVGEDSDLAKHIDELKARVEALAREVSESGIAERQRRALEKVALNAGKLLPDLDTEFPDDPVSLSVDDLMVKVRKVERDDYLWEIGSGANWLAYHIAITLGLQQFFIAQSQSPVPGLLVFDQPSQVYFPRRLATTKSDDAQEIVDDGADFWKDEDVVAVRKVFSTLDRVTSISELRLQVIVLDHAPEVVWQGIPNVHLVEEWRGGRKLVPMEWLRPKAE